MNYLSTRGGALPGTQFSDILLGGLAPDGGLTLCAEYPQISLAQLSAWAALPYADLAFEVISLFATDIPPDELRAMLRRAYTADTFKNTSSAEENPAEITPLKQLAPKLYLQALSNGPTLAFKDMAMQFLGQVFPYVLAKRGETLNILGATSGDTGSAAEYAMRGKPGVNVFMLSPHGRMSAFQRAQMFSLQDPNIHNIAVEGVFDDCQDIVKAVSNDLAFKAKYKIGAVNSINWGRIVAQVAYYFKGYLLAIAQSGGEVGEPVDFAVPSGNFGNICAGHIARQMGLPIRKLVLATNENDVLDEFFRTGRYRVRTSAQTLQTSSPSMDISKASNFERFLFDLVGRDAAKTAALMGDVDTNGGFDLSDNNFGQSAENAQSMGISEKYGFVSGRSTHADRLATIRMCKATYGQLIDTHTADGLKVALEHRDPAVPMVVLETALPAKFNETIVEALGADAPRPPGFEGIEHLPQRVTVMAADVAQVKAFIERHV
jgi:threonine synthase